MAPIGLLVKIVLESIVQVFLICLAGYLLARQGILDKRTQKQVNQLNVAFFTPALLFAKVAFFLTPSKLEHLWIVPVFFILASGISMAIAYLLGMLFRLKRTQRNFAAAAAMFMNSTSLPIALMQSLVGTIRKSSGATDDTDDAALSRALTIIMLFSCLGMILRWSVGVHILSVKDDHPEEDQQNDSSQQAGERPEPSRGRSQEPREGVLIDVESPTPPHEASGEDTNQPSPHGISYRVADGKLEKIHHIPAFFYVPRDPQRSQIRFIPSPSPESLSDSENGDGHDGQDTPLLLPRRSKRRKAKASAKRMVGRLWRRLRKFLGAINEMMSPPLWAAVLSLIVAMISPLQTLLNTKLDFIKSAATSAGNCAVPLTLVILGAYFHHEDDSSSEKVGGQQQEEHNNQEQGGKRSYFSNKMHGLVDQLRNASREKTPPGESATVAIAVLTRMVLAPLVLLPLMALGAHFNTPKIFEDPVLMVSLVLLVTGPPALMLVQITQQVSGETYERLISRTVFWAYCIVTPPAIIIYVVIGLLFVRL